MARHWSVHHLTEYLTAVSGPDDADGAVQLALERAVEALEADVGLVVRADEPVASLGFGAASADLGDDGSAAQMLVPGLGAVHLARAELSTTNESATGRCGRLVLGRQGEEFSAEEKQLVEGMALALGLVLRNIATLEAERTRHQLVETLLAIQRAISARRPLDELLAAITRGASSVLGGCPVALLLAGPDGDGRLDVASQHGNIGLDRQRYAAIQAAMAGGEPTADPGPGPGTVLVDPVIVGGETAGCLAAHTADSAPRRREQGALLSAFAQQVSFALTDARTVDEVRDAHLDAVTRLPNRPLFLQRLERARAAAALRGGDVTVLFIDLDRFKAVNDTLGHSAGDALLAEVGRRITSCASDHDVVARLGGDEFAVLLDRAGLDVGRAVAERVERAVSRSYEIGGREVFVGASIGIAAAGPGDLDAGTLLSDADIAMYRAKRSGRGGWVVFEPSMHDEVADRLALRADLQNAVAHDELWLAYQPIVGLTSRTVEKVEALLRWDHPTRGVVPPASFIPLAEETDVILELGGWVLHRALRDVGGWRPADRVGVSINISARQVVDPYLPELVGRAIAASALAPEAVTLEITESVLMDDPVLSQRRLEQLKDLGVRLSIDDFGTGYSSLAYLRQFPVDEVKIDRGFVSVLRRDSPDDLAIVRSVLELCQRLRLRTVAEGIETAEQLAILTELGCDLGQGFLLARPMPAHDCRTHLRGHTALAG